MEVTSARIRQIIPAPPGLMIDQWNYATALALVDITAVHDNGCVCKGSEILPVGMDGMVNGLPGDAVYELHPFGDHNRHFCVWAHEVLA